MQQPNITGDTIPIPTDTYKGLRVDNGSLLPTDAVAIGEDDKGGLWCFQATGEEMRMVGSLANKSKTTPSTVAYTSQQGSTIGFQQQFGVSVTATAGIDIKVFSASLSATASASLTFSQAFSKSTSHAVTAPAQPNKITCVYSGELYIKYYYLHPILGTQCDKDGHMVLENGLAQLKPISYLWTLGKADAIETGAFVVEEFDIGSSPVMG